MQTPLITSDVAKEAAQLVRDIGQTIEPAWQPLIGIVSDKLSYIRSVRQLKLMEAFQNKCRERGIDKPDRQVPPAFLVPFFEKATLENDDDLRQVWATMLANAVSSASEVDMRIAYVSMLSEMTNFDATILSALAVMAAAHPSAPYFICNLLPEAIGIGHNPTEPVMREDVAISLANLGRLGCLLPMNTYGGPSYNSITLTTLGKAFIRSCSNILPSHPKE